MLEMPTAQVGHTRGKSDVAGALVHVPSCGFSRAKQIVCVPNILDLLCIFRPSAQHVYHRFEDALRVGHIAYTTQLLVMHFSIGGVQNRIMAHSEVMLFTRNL